MSIGVDQQFRRIESLLYCTVLYWDDFALSYQKEELSFLIILGGFVTSGKKEE